MPETCITSLESFEPMVTKLCFGQEILKKINQRGIIQKPNKVESFGPMMTKLRSRQGKQDDALADDADGDKKPPTNVIPICRLVRRHKNPRADPPQGRCPGPAGSLTRPPWPPAKKVHSHPWYIHMISLLQSTMEEIISCYTAIFPGQQYELCFKRQLITTIYIVLVSCCIIFICVLFPVAITAHYVAVFHHHSGTSLLAGGSFMVSQCHISLQACFQMMCSS